MSIYRGLDFSDITSKILIIVRTESKVWDFCQAGLKLNKHQESSDFGQICYCGKVNKPFTE